MDLSEKILSRLKLRQLHDKGSPLKDAKKAEFYLCRLIQKLEQ